jgi:hypothetical protein
MYNFTSTGYGGINFTVADKELGLTHAILSLTKGGSSDSKRDTTTYLNITGAFKGASSLSGTLSCTLDPLDNIIGSLTISDINASLSPTYILNAFNETLPGIGGTFQSVCNEILDIKLKSLTLNISVTICSNILDAPSNKLLLFLHLFRYLIGTFPLKC